jgi:hypothetical protein
LYQVVNTGTAGSSSVEEFSVASFFGADPCTVELGYLTDATPPSGFLGDGEIPWITAGVDPTTTGGPTFSFNYQQIFGNSIAPGGNSAVMYIVDSAPVGEVTGNVIDGSVATGQVVGPVPEPATMVMLSLGALAMIRRRRKKI